MGFLQAAYERVAGVLQAVDLRGDADGNLHVAAVGRRIGEPITVSIANLAASAVAYAPGSGWIDLGEDWSPATLCVVGKYNGVLSANEKAALECSDDYVGTVIYLGIAATAANFAAAQLTFAGGNADAVAQFRPVARFIRGKYTNGSTQQGASAVLRVVCGAPA